MVAEETSSELSSVTGPVVVTPDLIPKIKSEPPLGIRADSVLWFDREIQIGTPILFGPTATTGYNFQPLGHLRSTDTLARILNRYAYLSYDELEFRITMSSPKALVGAAVVAVTPYQSVPGALGINPFANTLFDVHYMCMKDNSVLMPYGASEDVIIKFPWSFRQHVIPTADIIFYGHTGAEAPNFGWPILKVLQMTGAFVSSIAMPATLRVYMKVKGVKLYGPKISSPNALVFEPQMETLGATATGFAAKIAANVARDTIATGAAAFCEYTGYCAPEEASSFADSAAEAVTSFVKPESFMPTFLGDTTSISRHLMKGLRGPDPFVPKTVPVPEPREHSFMDFLSRPQYIGQYTSGTANVHPANCFVEPFGLDSVLPSWFNYFGRLARFWRGTVNFHFVVCGHPMVEVEFSSLVDHYGGVALHPPQPFDTETFTAFDTHRSVFSGVRTFVVPVPYVDSQELKPIATPAEVSQGDMTEFATATVRVATTVVSTMLDVAPVITTLMFMSAGHDFCFYDPRPPSAFLTAGDDLESRRIRKQLQQKKELIVFEPQVKLTPAQNVEVHSAHVKTSLDPGGMIPFRTLEQIMSLWSNLYPSGAYTFPETPFDYPGGNQLTLAEYDFACCDFLAYLSRIYQCYRGDIALKIVVELFPDDERTTVGWSYSDPTSNILTPYYAFTDNPNFPDFLNPGNGSYLTSAPNQPVIETSMTYRGTNTLGYTCKNDAERTYENRKFLYDEVSLPINHNFKFFDQPSNQFQDVVFRKIGPNFQMYIERLPPLPENWFHYGYPNPL